MFFLSDIFNNIIKYVGIVWANNRTLDDRIREHSANDFWCKGGYWKVEYLNRDIQNRMDAELLEAHYIGKFDTGKWYNTYKSSWGRSTLLDDSNDQWIEYGIICNTFSNTVSEYTGIISSFVEYRSVSMLISFSL